MGRTEVLTSEPWLARHFFRKSEMARSSECRDDEVPKVLDTADIVRAIYQQLCLKPQKYALREKWQSAG
jgi:hypothetical protein